MSNVIVDNECGRLPNSKPQRAAEAQPSYQFGLRACLRGRNPLIAVPWVLTPLWFGEWRICLALVCTYFAINFIGGGAGQLFGIWKSDDYRLWLSSGVGLILLGPGLMVSAKLQLSPFIWVASLIPLCIFGAVFSISSKAELPSRNWLAMSGLLLTSAALSTVNYGANCLRVEMPLNADGSTWFYVQDSTFNVSLINSIKNGVRPCVPGECLSGFGYHYGSHAIAATLCRLFSLTTREALLTIDGLGLLVLFQVIVGFSISILSATRSTMSPQWLFLPVVAVLFGSDIAEELRAVFRCAIQSCGFDVDTSRDLAFRSGVQGHFLHVHSLVWGLISAFTCLSLLAVPTSKTTTPWRTPLLFAVAALSCALNVFGGALSLSVIALQQFFVESPNIKSRLLLLGYGVLSFAFVVFVIVGANDNQLGTAGSRTIGSSIALSAEVMASLFWCVAGFGFAAFAFGWSARGKVVPFIVLVPVAVGCLLPLCRSMPCGDDRYLLLYAFHIDMAIAACVLASNWLSQDAIRYLRIAGVTWSSSTLLMQVVGATIVFLAGSHLFVDAPTRFAAPLILLLACVAAFNLKGTICVKLAQVSMVLLLLLQVGIGVTSVVAWTSASTRNDGLKLSADEVKGLSRVREVTVSNDICLTNRLLVNPVVQSADEGFMGCGTLYEPVSERRFVWDRMGDPTRQKAKADLADHQAVFQSGDPDQFWTVIDKVGATMIVCVPGTDLPQVPSIMDGLEKISWTGSMNIYRVKSKPPNRVAPMSVSRRQFGEWGATDILESNASQTFAPRTGAENVPHGLERRSDDYSSLS